MTLDNVERADIGIRYPQEQNKWSEYTNKLMHLSQWFVPFPNWSISAPTRNSSRIILQPFSCIWPRRCECSHWSHAVTKEEERKEACKRTNIWSENNLPKICFFIAPVRIRAGPAFPSKKTICENVFPARICFDPRGNSCQAWLSDQKSIQKTVWAPRHPMTMICRVDRTSFRHSMPKLCGTLPPRQSRNNKQSPAKEATESRRT